MSGAGRIVIETRPGEVRACALDDHDTPIAFRIERDTRRSHVGAVYLGRVAAVRREIGAAFVDLGLGIDGFLNLKEGAADARGTEIAEGAAVLVQIGRDAQGDKGPALTTAIDIVAQALVLTPGRGGLGLSGRISDDDARARLKALFADADLGAAGLVVRTGAPAMPDADILNEYAQLCARWQALADEASAATAPALVRAAPGLAERMLSRYAGPDLRDILVDDAQTRARIIAFAGQMPGGTCPDPVMARGGEAAFRAAGLEDAFDAALSPHVPLPGGGSLIVTETPAMTTVDVNAGRAAAGNPERLALETNLQAADVLARTLMLRGIGGLIAVDFMKMREDASQKRVLRALNENFRGDPENPRAGTFSRFGIVDIVRQRHGPSLAALCLDRHEILSAESVALEALARIARHGGTGAVVHAAPVVVAQLDGPLADVRKSLEQKLGFDIRLEAVPDAAPDLIQIESPG